MRQIGIRSAVRGRVVKITVTDTSAPCPRHKVNRILRAPAPNLLWVSDFTYVSTWQRVRHRHRPRTVGDQCFTLCGFLSSTPHAAIDLRFRHAVQLNNRSCDDTSFKTLPLFLKIKVSRPPYIVAVHFATKRCRAAFELLTCEHRAAFCRPERRSAR